MHVTLASTAAPALRAFELAMRKHRAVLQCHEISGEIDYILFVVARDMEQLSRALNASVGAHANVSGDRSHLVMRSAKLEHALPMELASIGTP